MSAPFTNLRAIVLAISAFTLWVLCDSAIKLAGNSSLPNYEIVGFLGAFIAVFVVGWCGVAGDLKALKPIRPGALFFRGLLDVGNNLFVVVALRHLSLTLFYILVFLSPILVVLLSWVFLRESLGWKKGVAIVAGFLGVLVAVDPLHTNFRADWQGYGACLICVVCFSSGIVWSRKLLQDESAQSANLFSGLAAMAAGGAGMIYKAEPLNGWLLLVLISMGVLCALGNLSFYKAVKQLPSGVVSQYHYTQLVAGAIIAWRFFHEYPTVNMIIGAIIILVAGVFMAVFVSRERQSPAIREVHGGYD